MDYEEREGMSWKDKAKIIGVAAGIIGSFLFGSYLGKKSVEVVRANQGHTLDPLTGEMVKYQAICLSNGKTNIVMDYPPGTGFKTRTQIIDYVWGQKQSEFKEEIRDIDAIIDRIAVQQQE